MVWKRLPRTSVYDHFWSSFGVYATENRDLEILKKRVSHSEGLPVLYDQIVCGARPHDAFESMTFDGNPYLASSRHGNGRGSFLIMLGHFDSNFSRPTTRNSWVGKGHLSKLYHRKHGVLHWKLLQLGWFVWAMSAIDKREVLWLLSDLWSLPRRWSAPSATSWRVSVRSRSNRGHTPGQ